MGKKVIAVLPSFIEGYGIGSQVYYEDEVAIDSRTTNNFLKNMCDERNISVKLMKRQVSTILQIRRNIPRFIDSSHVFFSFTYAESPYREARRGFVNVKYVSHIEGSSIILYTGEHLDSLNTQDALVRNLHCAKLLLYMQLYENSQDALADAYFNRKEHKRLEGRLDQD